MLPIHHLLNGLSTPREIPAFRVLPPTIRMRTQIEVSTWAHPWNIDLQDRCAFPIKYIHKWSL